MEKKNNRQPVRRGVSFKTILNTLVAVFVMGYLFCITGKRIRTSYWLKQEKVRVKAVIIDEKNYMGNSPVSHESTYSYLFYVNGKAYTNNSHDSKLQVGDSVVVEYAKAHPYANRRVADTIKKSR